ncbi:threonine/serine exporter family protein [Nocardia sp. PE-7]|uniref:threonine/serine ThrE exporter family protein n=1 Tax=Nocardia sp. PE-7 TaxID=3058426 RepID=UPI00265B10C7|nr:threonine/serine exporter family protein [Nocardia sp. PE-7]WKG09519.1 threonine/serine exporter family protein [Nocardia sp. PE-7]
MASEEYASKTWKVARARVTHAIAKIREEYAKAAPRPTEHDPVDPPVPADLLNLLCRIGVALVGAGETSARVQVILDKLSRRYGTDNIHFMVLPTAVFVRVRTDESSAIDMLDARVGTLPLDQIDGLYRLIDRIEQDAPSPSQASTDLDKILTQKPGSPPWLILLGQVVLTVGIGMMLNPGARALVGYVVLGLVVGALTQLADKVRLLSMALPVVASAVVAALAYGFPGALAGGQPQQLLIPAVATLLPGAMLTNGTIELATGSMVAGASRVVYGINMLFLLALGSYVGISLLGPLSDPPVSTAQLGWWAPLLGVLLIGYGHSWRSSAPQNTVGWLLLVLYVTYAAQVLGKHVSGPLTGTFLGGLVAVNAAYLIQSRKHAPPTQVAFLPAFWMLVPGGISYTGISDLVTHSLSGVSSGGLEVLVSALLSVMSIALGVMVGSGLATAHAPRVSTIIDTVVPHHLPWVHTSGTTKKPDSDS